MTSGAGSVNADVKGLDQGELSETKNYKIKIHLTRLFSLSKHLLVLKVYRQRTSFSLLVFRFVLTDLLCSVASQLPTAMPCEDYCIYHIPLSI